MKKLIVFSVVFALLAGTAFAQASIGGAFGVGMKIISGDSSEKGDDDPALFTDLGSHWAGVDFNWTADDGSVGAKIKLNGDTNKGHEGDWNARVGGGIWWRPLELVRVKLWHIEDEGDLGRGNAIDWGYQANGSAGEVTTLWGGGWNSFSNATLRTGNGFFGGVGGGGDPHLLVELFPIPGLTVGLAWALGSGSTEDFFKRTLAQVKYDINGIGNFAISFAGFDGSWAAKSGYSQGIMAQTLAVDFFLTSLPGMGIGVGARIPVAAKATWGIDGYADADDITAPIEIGLEYTLNQWSGEAFHLYARAGMQLPTEDLGDYTAIAVDINPSYDIGMFRIFFDFGIAFATQKDNDDSDFFWHFNPYLKKSIGGIGDLYFGLNFWNGTARGGYESDFTIQGPDATKIINFAVPVFFTAWF